MHWYLLQFFSNLSPKTHVLLALSSAITGSFKISLTLLKLSIRVEIIFCWWYYKVEWNACRINSIVCSSRLEITVISWTSSSPNSPEHVALALKHVTIFLLLPYELFMSWRQCLFCFQSKALWYSCQEPRALWNLWALGVFLKMFFLISYQEYECSYIYKMLRR